MCTARLPTTKLPRNVDISSRILDMNVVEIVVVLGARACVAALDAEAVLGVDLAGLKVLPCIFALCAVDLQRPHFLVLVAILGEDFEL